MSFGETATLEIPGGLEGPEEDGLLKRAGGTERVAESGFEIGERVFLAGRMMSPRAVRPWRVAFCDEDALPCSVLGPVESWALARLASICAGVDMIGDGSFFG